MERRTFLGVIAGGLLAAPLAVGAQPGKKVYRIGFLDFISPDVPHAYSKAFLQGLHALGYVEGRDFVMEYRFAAGHKERLPELAADLVRANVDVIVTYGTPPKMALKQATQTIPIVFTSAADVVEKGIVASLAQPGGNVTGLQLHMDETKVLQLLKEAVPTVARVVFLYDPAVFPGTFLGTALQRRHAQAQALNVKLQPVAVRDPNGVAAAFAEFGRGTNGLWVEASDVLIKTSGQVCSLALQRRLPAIGYGSWFPNAGCLMSYGEDVADMHRRAAGLVDKILKGAKPGDLPVEQPTKFDLIINLKTAKALELAIPQSLLLRADRVIE
jgi:ABC-type uncharacterized transport system substrate-binding protein